MQIPDGPPDCSEVDSRSAASTKTSMVDGDESDSEESTQERSYMRELEFLSEDSNVALTPLRPNQSTSTAPTPVKSNKLEVKKLEFEDSNEESLTLDLDTDLSHVYSLSLSLFFNSFFHCTLFIILPTFSRTKNYVRTKDCLDILQ